MSIEPLERAARELAPFLDEVAFVGGATVALWITDPAAREPRPTKDVDLVVEVTSRLGWYDFEARLREHGLQHDITSAVICRWRAGSDARARRQLTTRMWRLARCVVGDDADAVIASRATTFSPAAEADPLAPRSVRRSSYRRGVGSQTNEERRCRWLPCSSESSFEESPSPRSGGGLRCAPT